MYELCWSVPCHVIAESYIQCTTMYFCFSFDLGITIRRLSVPDKTWIFTFKVYIFNYLIYNRKVKIAFLLIGRTQFTTGRASAFSRANTGVMKPGGCSYFDLLCFPFVICVVQCSTPKSRQVNLGKYEVNRQNIG